MRTQGPLICGMVTCLILMISCQKKEVELPNTHRPNGIVLIWNQSDSETRADIETGMKWYFSMLGATLPPRALEKGFEWISDRWVWVDFEALGFSSKAVSVLNQLVDRFRETQEFNKNLGIDMGRFVAVTLNNSNHYYKIVDMPQTFAGFDRISYMANYEGAIRPSSVSFGYRKVLFPHETNYRMSFISEEYVSDFTKTSHEPVEFEVIDLMPNGQLRFGIYAKGNLLDGADARFSAGGKPSKCMWCHESSFLPNFAQSQSFSGYLTNQEFNDTIAYHNQDLAELRDKLQTMFDFNQKQEHTQMELVYIRFFEPSASRLANEWGMSVSDVRERLSNLETHIHGEFPELGDLYYRHEVEPLAPVSSLLAPREMRESEESQPLQL